MNDNLSVSLRDYVERLFAENQRAVDAAFKNQMDSLERARAHIEAIFEEHRRAHNQKHIDDERALEAARRAVDLRLEKLNELRSEVISDRGQFVRKDALEAQLKPLNDFRSRALGLGAAIGIVSGGVGAIVGAFVIRFLGG